jgi:hypothetical protein
MARSSFALLFVLGVTRWAYGAFKENNAANTPPKAFNTVRLVFLCSFFFGLVPGHRISRLVASLTSRHLCVSWRDRRSSSLRKLLDAK